MGFAPGANVDVIQDHGRIEILPNIHSLARVYIEPTSRCNLSCQTCIRNTWNEPTGDMDLKIFEKAANKLSRFPHLDSVMFGGFGEPTVHKDILYMIQSIKSLGLKAEMVTNGTLLDEVMLAGLMKSKLDTLWESFDGTMETSFEDIREGASFQKVVDSLKLLQKMNRRSPHKIEIGIAFVVMKKNINDLSLS